MQQALEHAGMLVDVGLDFRELVGKGVGEGDDGNGDGEGPVGLGVSGS
jgi:hypothetical protein